MELNNYTKEVAEALQRARELSQEYGQSDTNINHLLLSMPNSLEALFPMLGQCETYVSWEREMQTLDKYSMMFTDSVSLETFIERLANTQPTCRTEMDLIRLMFKDSFQKTFIYKILAQEGIGRTRTNRILQDLFEKMADNGLVTVSKEEAAKRLASKIRDLSFLNIIDGNKFMTNPAIAREKELELIQKALMHLYKPNALLVGDPGVGKTAIAEGLAYLISRNLAHPMFKDTLIVSLSLGGAIAGTRYRGDFEKKITKTCDSLCNENVILFIDEFHRSTDAGGADGAVPMSDILKPYLVRGELRIIGCTTNDEFNRLMTDRAYNRRFEKIMVNEPSVEDTEKMLLGSLSNFAKHYKIEVPHKLVKAICQLAPQLGGKLPDIAFTALEKACCEAVWAEESIVTREHIEKVFGPTAMRFVTRNLS